MTKTAIYARVSSARQKEEKTIASQTAALQEYAASAGLEVPPQWIFEDEGFSGATLVRPGLERLRDLVAEIEIGIVLCYSPDRLARRYAYQALLIEELARCGTEVRFLKGRKAETPEDELVVQFQGMIAEYERAQITERTRRGKLHRARSGSVAVFSTAPYGYCYVRKSEVGDARFEIVEPQATVVRELFRRYVEERESLGSLTRWVSDHGVPSATGKTLWSRSAVWTMLRNPAYCGRAAFGKTEHSGLSVRPNRVRRLRGRRVGQRPSHRKRPPEQWIEIPVPAIISEQTFALAQRRLQENKRFAARRTQEPALLQGLVACQSCGYSFYRTSTSTTQRRLRYYRCSGCDAFRFAHGRVCWNRQVREEYLDTIVWDHVIGLLADPVLVRSELERRVREPSTTGGGTIATERLGSELRRVTTAMERLVDAYQNELLSLDELRGRMPELRRRQATIRSELDTLKERAVDREQYLKLAETLESFLSKLYDAASHAAMEERQRLIRLVVKDVLVGPDTIVIRHSIPVPGRDSSRNYPLRPWRRCAVA